MKSIFILTLFLHTLLYAHPHVFMDASTQIKVNDNVLEGIKIKATFDEMNTMIYMEEYDKNKDKKLNEQETQLFLKEVFHYFKGNYSHFYIRFDDKKIETEELKILNVGIENNLLFYEVYLPLNLKINDNNTLVLSIYDAAYYFTYFYDDDSVTSTDKSKILYTILQKNKDMSYYFGNINPLEIEVMFN